MRTPRHPARGLALLSSLAALALAVPTPAAAQSGRVLLRGEEDALGFSLGAGAGSFTAGGESISFSDYLEGLSPRPLAFAARLTRPVSPRLVWGLELSLLRTSGSGDARGMSLGGRPVPDGSTVEAATRTTSLVAFVSWFPGNDRVFVRAGAGVGSLVLSLSTAIASGQYSVFGPAGLAGAGVTFWPWERAQVTVGLDAFLHRYGTDWDQPVEQTRSFVLTAGIDWF